MAGDAGERIQSAEGRERRFQPLCSGNHELGTANVFNDVITIITGLIAQLMNAAMNLTRTNF